MSKEKLFSFNTPEFSDYKLEVVSFKGSQEIGELYSYEIDLVSKKDDIDFDKMLQTEVSLQLHNKDADDIYIHGVLAQFEAHQKIDKHIYYKAYLVPKLWHLSMSIYQQIFLDKKIDEIIESIFKDAKFTSADYELRLQGTYDKREYVCQYKESRYDFLRRWMEREGIYFYFEQDENGCKVIITDAKEKHKKLPKMDKLLYRPSSGLQEFKQQAVSSIVYRSNSTIKSVHMRNSYNYEKPSTKLDSVTESSKDDYTQTYLFGNNLSTQEEVKKSVAINEEKYLCLAKEMSAESNIVSLTPGCIYTLSDYFKDDLNDDYLMLRVESEGSQRGFLSAGFTNDGGDSSYYNNTFMMIPSQTQYRMQTSTLWPQIGGMISAIIDASASGETAELDEDGRYKVIMPFDLSGRDKAKASAYIRMAQPSAGEKQGIHFPLHKGAEVLISFIDGDPDQPVITGAVPNKDAASPVNDKNVTESIIKTHSGNKIEIEDESGKEHIKLELGDGSTEFTLKKGRGFEYKTEGSSYTDIQGNELTTILGAKEEFVAGAVVDTVAGGVVDIKLIEVFEFTGAIKEEVMIGGLFSLQVAAGVEVATEGIYMLTPESKELKALKIEIHDNTTTIEGNSERIDENLVRIFENVDSIGEEKQSLIDNELKAIQDRVTVIENDLVTGDNMNILTVDMDIAAAGMNIDAAEMKIDAVEMNIAAAEMNIGAVEMNIASGEMNIEAVAMNIDAAIVIVS